MATNSHHLNWTIAPALPREVEAAEARFAAKLREVGPLWGMDDEAEAEQLRLALVAAYDAHDVPADERRVDV